jgi:hypothetical protein
MSRLHVAALLAMSALAIPASTALAQVIFGRGMEGVPDRSIPGRATESDDVYTCQAAPGGSRVRENCDVETTTLRLEQEMRIAFKLKAPPPPPPQCSAATTTEYRQFDTTARVAGTLEIRDCAAASGKFTVAAVVRDEGGEEKALEFSETWQRSDDNDVSFAGDYPIGENVELVSVRLRGLTCTCTALVAEEEPAAVED